MLSITLKQICRHAAQQLGQKSLTANLDAQNIEQICKDALLYALQVQGVKCIIELHGMPTSSLRLGFIRLTKCVTRLLIRDSLLQTASTQYSAGS